MTDRNSMATYVCGPMSGVRQFNIPLFDSVAEDLRKKGSEVISPAELDSEAMREFALKSETGNMTELTEQLVAAGHPRETWGDVLARDVKMIHDDIGAFALLPGWEKSRGARLEVFVGLLVGVTRFVLVREGGYWGVSADFIRDKLRANMP